MITVIINGLNMSPANSYLCELNVCKMLDNSGRPITQPRARKMTPTLRFKAALSSGHCLWNILVIRRGRGTCRSHNNNEIAAAKSSYIYFACLLRRSYLINFENKTRLYGFLSHVDDVGSRIRIRMRTFRVNYDTARTTYEIYVRINLI